MSHPVSACVFIRNTFWGAFCLFESMASLLPYVSEFLVLDLGSEDGTYEILSGIAQSNRKVKLLRDKFPDEPDASVFADLANVLVECCNYPNVLYYQADEIWHESLLAHMENEFLQGRFDLSFWRIQYRDNFQRVKWFPHLVHRVGRKGRFNFTGDGMTTDRTWDARICSSYDGGYFMRWGEMGQEGIKPYVHEMIMDVSLVGGFRDNIPERRRMHAPFWHEEPDIEGRPASRWLAEERNNPDWERTQSPYNLPAIMRFHVGQPVYTLRDDLLEAINSDTTREYIEGLRA